MGTQKGIANLVVLKGADYVLSLKKNHKRFYKKITNLFHNAEESKYTTMVYREKTTFDYDHSRYEKREYKILPLMYLHEKKKEWSSLQTFVQVKSIRYYISS